MKKYILAKYSERLSFQHWGLDSLCRNNLALPPYGRLNQEIPLKSQFECLTQISKKHLPGFLLLLLFFYKLKSIKICQIFFDTCFFPLKTSNFLKLCILDDWFWFALNIFSDNYSFTLLQVPLIVCQQWGRTSRRPSIRPVRRVRDARRRWCPPPRSHSLLPCS